MAQLFRGELGRSDRWRTRLDTTTNWALTTTAAVISYTFANPLTPHATIVVGIWMVVLFLMIEARRYRYYDLWIRRVRLLEDGYWAPMLRREPVDPDAMRELAHELSRPRLRMSFSSALGIRLRQAYGPVLIILMLTWYVKVHTHPEPAKTFREFLERCHVGWVPGGVVAVVMALFGVTVITMYIMAWFARAPVGELRARPRPHRSALFHSFFKPYAAQPPRRRNLGATPQTRS